ncbi:MAG TPA: flagellar basal body rod protein FlgB [Burkholderiaceae bacterium]
MTEGIERVTTAALSLALDAAAMRQQAIAANIANADVPGYQPVTVDFESQLDAAQRSLEDGGRLDMDALADVEPRFVADVQTQPAGLSPKVMLDMEMARLAQNGVQYQALATALNKQFTLMSIAVNDGKR